MRIFLIAVLFSCLNLFGLNAAADSVAIDSVQAQSDEAVKKLSVWTNRSLRKQLLKRINDNKELIEFLQETKLSEMPSEIDQSFDYQVSNLVNDQLGLSYFANNLVPISQQESIDIDALLQERESLQQEYINSLNYTQGLGVSRHLLNRLLYISLMNKYAG